MIFIILLCIHYLYFNIANGFSPTEPSIECTVVKVLKQQNIGQLKKFPKLYTSINNNPITSKLSISGVEFKDTDPVSQIKTESYEKIILPVEKFELTLELNGKPISRNGVLKSGSLVLAKVTCH